MAKIKDSEALPSPVVKHLCLLHGAWIIGGAANGLLEARDIDLLIPPERWRAAAAYVSSLLEGGVIGPMKLTTFGGLRFTCPTLKKDVDVFTESLFTILECGRCRGAWHPATGVRFTVTN